MAGSNEELRKGPMVGRMESGNFEDDTIVFKMQPEYYLASGQYVIEPMADWQARCEKLAALAPAQEPAGGGEDAEQLLILADMIEGGRVDCGYVSVQVNAGSYRTKLVAALRRLATPTPQAAGVSEAMVERALNAYYAPHGLAQFDEIQRACKRDAMRAALTAAGAAPEGWQPVPKEPTDAMYAAARKATWIGERYALLLWQSMLAAAPQPGAQEQSA